MLTIITLSSIGQTRLLRTDIIIYFNNFYLINKIILIMPRGHVQSEGSSDNPFVGFQHLVVSFSAKTVAADNKTPVKPAFTYQIKENGVYTSIPSNKTEAINKDLTAYLLSFTPSYAENKDNSFNNMVFRLVAPNDKQLSVDGTENDKTGVVYELKMYLTGISQGVISKLGNLDKNSTDMVGFSIFSPEPKEGEKPTHKMLVRQGKNKLEYSIGYPTKQDGTVNPFIKPTDRNTAFCKEVLDVKIPEGLSAKEKTKLSTAKREKADLFFFGTVGLVSDENGKPVVDSKGKTKGLPIVDCFCADLAQYINGEYRTNILQNVFGVKLVDKEDGSKTYVKITDETADTATDDNETFATVDAKNMAEPVGEDGLPF